MPWGICCSPATPSGRTRPRALELYQQAAQAGHMGALRQVGRCYQKGKGCQKDEAKAFDCFRRSAEGGDGRRQWRWDTATKRAAAAPADAAQAAHWYEEAAAGACRWGSTIWAACMRQDRASHGIGERRWSCTVRRHRRSGGPTGGPAAGKSRQSQTDRGLVAGGLCHAHGSGTMGGQRR